jgi:hypothetical protein
VFQRNFACKSDVHTLTVTRLHIGASGSSKVDVWHGLVHGARVQDINLYSHKMIIYPSRCDPEDFTYQQ